MIVNATKAPEHETKTGLEGDQQKKSGSTHADTEQELAASQEVHHTYVDDAEFFGLLALVYVVFGPYWGPTTF